MKGYFDNFISFDVKLTRDTNSNTYLKNKVQININIFISKFKIHYFMKIVKLTYNTNSN